MLLILTCHVVSNEMKRTSSNSLRSASWTWHISNPLCSLPFTHFTISPSTSSVCIHIALPPLLTDFSGSSPSSPNTKPEPLHGQSYLRTNSGLPGSSCASVLLPMPHRRQRSSHLSASCKGFEIVCIVCVMSYRHKTHRTSTRHCYWFWTVLFIATWTGSLPTGQDAFKMKSTFWPS